MKETDKSIHRCRVWIFALTLLSLCATGAVLQFMPDRVPMHFGASGAVDRIGSKYETLLFPALTALTGGIMLLTARICGRRAGSAAQKALARGGVLICAALAVLFFVLQCRIAACSAEAADGASIFSRIFGMLTSTSTGLLVIVLSNLMPKAERNSLFGLRTTWSGKNDRVWQQCQRFGGWTGIVCGILILISGAFFPLPASGWVMLALILLWSAVCMIASYQIWKRDCRDHPAQ